jgi:hypothetical protein
MGQGDWGSGWPGVRMARGHGGRGSGWLGFMQAPPHVNHDGLMMGDGAYLEVLMGDGGLHDGLDGRWTPRNILLNLVPTPGGFPIRA